MSELRQGLLRHLLGSPRRIPQISVDRRDHNARVDCEQVDTPERKTKPGINDDTFIEDAIKDIDEVRTAGRPFKSRTNCRSAHWALRRDSTPPRLHRGTRVATDCGVDTITRLRLWGKIVTTRANWVPEFLRAPPTKSETAFSVTGNSRRTGDVD